MKFLYSLGVRLYAVSIHVAARFGNVKAQLWISGRRDWRQKLIQIRSDCSKPVLWMHVASLGEYEMGVPVLEKLDATFDVIVSVFSPSAFEVLKKRNIRLIYLPLSTAANARDFLNIVKPAKVIFVRYDLWYHYVNQINQRKILFYLICCSFKKYHWFFSPVGSFMKSELLKLKHIFTMTDYSSKVLEKEGFRNFSFAGDTRCDRVLQNVSYPFADQVISKFATNQKVFVCGSTWPEDEEELRKVMPWLRAHNYKLVIAPHEISHEHLAKLQTLFNGDLYSDGNISGDVLIIDFVGALKYIYRYGQLAYVGGGFKQGLHNILEPAAYSCPVIFGPKGMKYEEAIGMTDSGGAFCVNNAAELVNVLSRLNDIEVAEAASLAAFEYVKRNAGASDLIVSKIDALPT